LIAGAVTVTGLLPFASPNFRRADSAPRSRIYTVISVAAALGVVAVLVRLDIWLAEDPRHREEIVTADWVASMRLNAVVTRTRTLLPAR
jgi:uncharacterized membrane protein